MFRQKITIIIVGTSGNGERKPIVLPLSLHSSRWPVEIIRWKISRRGRRQNVMTLIYRAKDFFIMVE